MSPDVKKIYLSCLTRLKTAFQSTSCWGDSWRRVLPWQLLSLLSLVPFLRVRLRFMASCSSLDAASTAGCVHLFSGTSAVPAGLAEVEHRRNPSVIHRCDRNKSSVTSSPKRTSWVAERDAGLFLCDLLTVMHVCMKPSCCALYVTMYHVVSHVRYPPDRGWRSVNYSSLLIFICSVCFVVDYTFYVRFVWKPVAATEKR